MRKITRGVAKKLAKKYLLRSNVDTYHFIHTKKVVQAVQLISRGRKLNEEILEICAWTHDIGYYIDKNNFIENCHPHAENSINLLKKEGYEVNKKIEDCILNHGSKGNPKTNEGKVLQIAVKFNIIDKDFLQYLIEERAGGKEVEFLKKRTESAVKMLRKLRKLKI
mgnify:CR=1 FL=1|tara:strand:+ start:3742 stop:4239 length:498 start_codon:yes stop_codon:yes gene_type:complete